jgi:pSer/pThr/pTyr-binding forkhead associated (FHA) protein
MRDNHQPAAEPPAADPRPRDAQMSGVFQKDPSPEGGWGFVLPHPDGTFDVAVASNGAVIGSGPEANIRIAGPGVAPNHARIEVRGDGVYLYDLGGEDGTYVSGVRAARIGIVHGDIVRFGRVLLIFVGRGLAAYKGRVEVDSPFFASPSDASAFVDPAIQCAKAGRSFVIEGGPGIGKRTLALLAARKRADRGRTVTVDAADLGPDSPVRLPASGAGTYVIAHADLAPRAAQAEIAQAAIGSSAIVIATFSTPFELAISAGAVVPAFAAMFGSRRICIPPLDARREDIPGIIWAVGRKIGIDQDRITVELVERFARASWPGGIKEVEDALGDAAASSEGPLDGDAVRKPLARTPSRPPSSPALDDPALARERLADAIARADGSIAAAARLLGTSRQAIYREAERLGLDVSKQRSSAKNG